MAADYDEPRKTDDEIAADSIEALTAARVDKAAAAAIDEPDYAEDLELPGADLSEERLSVLVLPRQADEFTCTSCFLLRHRSQLHRAGVSHGGTGDVCADCA